MSSSTPLVSTTDAERWVEWQARGLAGDRRRTLVLKWVMGIIAVMLGALFGTSL